MSHSSPVNDNQGLVPVNPIQEMTVLGKLGGEEQPLVQSDVLHQRLGVQAHHRDWIKRRIKERKLKLGKDFVCRYPAGGKQKGRGGCNKKVCFLTLQAAKDVADSENTETGREMREPMHSGSTAGTGVRAGLIRLNQRQKPGSMG